jgi:hypothetical protein
MIFIFVKLDFGTHYLQVLTVRTLTELIFILLNWRQLINLLKVKLNILEILNNILLDQNDFSSKELIQRMLINNLFRYRIPIQHLTLRIVTCLPLLG